LACVSRDATGSETIVNAVVADEEFTATGLVIHERNYLDVYPYDKWTGKEIHAYEVGGTFEPTELGLHEGVTTAPALLTEADLIALMEKHGIGTDATHAEHINTIKERVYIGEADGGKLVPGKLGIGLVEGYEAMTLTLAEPKLRAGLEADLKLICEGRKDPKLVLAEQIEIYRAVFKVMSEKVREMDKALAHRLEERPQEPATDPVSTLMLEEVFPCPKCQRCAMALKRRDTGLYSLGCLGFPECRNVIWLSDMVREVTATSDVCPKCGAGHKMLRFRFKHQHTLALLGSDSMTHYTACLLCDAKLREMINVNVDQVKRVGGIVGAGVPPRNTARVPPAPWPTNPRPAPAAQPPVRRPATTGSAGVTGGTRGDAVWGPNGWTYEAPRNPTPVTNASSSWTGTNDSGGWGSSSNPAPAPRVPNASASWNGPNSTNSNNTNRRQSGGGMDCPTCKIPAKQLTVKKEGPNKGRMFYLCPNKDSNKCNFFKWADEVDIALGGGGGGGPPRPGGGGGGGFDGPSSSGPLARQPRPTAKRKCGHCRQEGHTRNKCPLRQDLDM
jgi:DNA topoisomerase III